MLVNARIIFKWLQLTWTVRWLIGDYHTTNISLHWFSSILWCMELDLNSLSVHYFTIFQLNMSFSPPHLPPPLLWILVIKQKLYHPISNSTRDHWHHSKRENIIRSFYLCVTWHLAISSGRRVGVLYHWKKEELALPAWWMCTLGKLCDHSSKIAIQIARWTSCWAPWG